MKNKKKGGCSKPRQFTINSLPVQGKNQKELIIKLKQKQNESRKRKTKS